MQYSNRGINTIVIIGGVGANETSPPSTTKIYTMHIKAKEQLIDIRVKFPKKQTKPY